MKLGFIGTGNMASAIIDGLIQTETVNKEDIFVSSGTAEEAAAFAKTRGVHACATNLAVVEAADTVIFAVKPNILPAVLKETSETLQEQEVLVVSIAAGTTLAMLEAAIGSPYLPIVRVMPNVNAMVGAGVAAICGNKRAAEEDVTQVLRLFQAVGSAYELPEASFSNFIALAGSSPAYAYMFIDAMSRAGVKHGLPKQLATEIAAQAVLGSAKMVLESDKSPWDLVDMVSSPGGTTVAGVLALEEAGFLTAITKGLDATIEKDQEMQNRKAE